MKKKSAKKKSHPNLGKINTQRHPWRPTLYDAVKTLAGTREYLESCKDGYAFVPVQETVILVGIKKKHTPTKMQVQKVVKLPTIEGLANHLHINKDTVQEWRKIYPDFSVLIEELLNNQAAALINNGLSGEYSQVIAKVLLVKHGYIDRQDSENKHKGLPSLSKLLSAAAKRERGE